MNKSLHIDKEAVVTLSMAQEGLLNPVFDLMNKEEAKKVDDTGLHNGVIFPFSFILAPSGRRNEIVLKNAKKGDRLEFINDGKNCGFIIVDEVFPIDILERIKGIYGSKSIDNEKINYNYKRLGNFAVCGKYEIKFEQIKDNKRQIEKYIKETNAKEVSSIILSGNPFHRIHERIIRSELVQSGLLVVFLRRTYKEEKISYALRYKVLKYFCDNFIQKGKILILPLENTYIFSGLNEFVLNAIVLKNYRIDNIVIGQSQPGLSLYWDNKELTSSIDALKKIKIKIKIIDKFVYCSSCGALVSTSSCPHSTSDHVKYESESIVEFFNLGIMPPAILMRKELSAMILSSLYPKRKKILKKVYENIFTSSSIIEDFENEDFYIGLMDLYQTSSLN